jgi:DNA-binding response OmpR family regulator
MDGGNMIMEAQSVMWLELVSNLGIRCRFISEWFKVDSYIPSKERLLAEIERNKPDVVVMDLGLYERVDGIDTSRMIRSRFDVPVMYI